MPVDKEELQQLQNIRVRLKAIKQRREYFKKTIEKEQQEEQQLYLFVRDHFKDYSQVFKWWMEDAQEGHNVYLVESFKVLGKNRPLRSIRDVLKYIKEYS